MKAYYDKNGITIYCGECSEILAHFPELHFDLTVTSPPYDNLREYHGYTFNFDAISKQLWRVTGKGGVVVWVVADQTINGSESGTSFRQALGFMELGFKLHDTMIWEKQTFTATGALKTRYAQIFEYMFVLAKNTVATFNPIKDRETRPMKRKHGTVRQSDGTFKSISDVGKSYGGKPAQRFNIWKINTEVSNSNRFHPGQFPESLPRDHIISWSNPGDLVLDPMAGSGTTGKMALELGRRCVMIDISEEYCKIMVERLRQPSFWSLPVGHEPKDQQAELWR